MQEELFAGMAYPVDYAKEKVDVERSIYDWVIPDFEELFQMLNKRKRVARAGARRGGREKQVDSSDMEIVSATFIRGQLVQRTCLWQVELRRNGAHLCVGLSCLECFHENIDEIWTRFDIDIVDFKGEVCHSQSAGVHFCSENVTKFVPSTKIGDKREAKTNLRCSFWETDAISMNDLQNNWDKLVPMNMINLRLRLHIYRDKPFDEASHIAEYHEPVKLCYTDNLPPSSSPLLAAVKNLWESKEDVDIKFRVQGREISAHKFVISAMSPVLKSLAFDRKDDSTIELHVASPQAFEQVLKYLYTQDAADIKASTDVRFIASVLDACNQLKIPSLARVCLVRLLTNMTVENFPDTAFSIYSRVTLEESFFKTEVKKFLLENQKELRKSEAFQKASGENVDHFLQLCFEPMIILRSASTATPNN